MSEQKEILLKELNKYTGGYQCNNEVTVIEVKI